MKTFYHIGLNMPKPHRTSLVKFRGNIVSSLLVDSVKMSESDTSPLTFMRSDVFLLFNQERLDKLTKEQVKDWVDNINLQSNDTFADGAFSDDELHAFCKSRYIQSASELKAWEQHLTKYSDFLAQQKKAMDNKDTSKDVKDIATDSASDEK